MKSQLLVRSMNCPDLHIVGCLSKGFDSITCHSPVADTKYQLGSTNFCSRLNPDPSCWPHPCLVLLGQSIFGTFEHDLSGKKHSNISNHCNINMSELSQLISSQIHHDILSTLPQSKHSNFVMFKRLAITENNCCTHPPSKAPTPWPIYQSGFVLRTLLASWTLQLFVKLLNVDLIDTQIMWLEVGLAQSKIAP
jgi:hypothetical protein